MLRGTLPAATITWDGSSADGLWATGANWSTNTVPATADTINFDTDLSVAPWTIALGANRTVAAVTFSSGTANQGFTISGNVLTIGAAAGIANNDNDTQTFTSTVALGASQTWSAASGSLVFGDVNLSNTNTARTLTVSGSFNTTIGGNITNGGTGAGAITKTGTGALTLSGTNTYTGATTISTGTLNLNSAGALGGNGTLSLADATTLNNTSAGPVTLTSTNAITLGNITFTGSQDLNLGTGAVSIGATSKTVTVSAGNLTLGGIISQSSGSRGLTKAGAGTLILDSTASTYTGPTTITGGTLAVKSLANGGVASSIGNSAATATNLVIDGGTLKYTGAGSTSNRLFQIGNSTVGGTATIDASGTGALVLNGTGSLAYGTTNQNRSLILTGSNTADNTLTPVLANNGTGVTTLTKNGAGTWVVSGNNSYTGATTINGGTLKLGSAGGGANGPLGTTAAGTTVNAGALDLNGYTLATAEALTLNGAGIASGGSLTNSGAAATFSGAVTLGSAATIGGTGNITLANATPLAGNFLLTKSGSGNLILNNSSGARTGGLQIDAGTVTFGSNTAIGATSQTIALNGGTLDLASASAVSTYPVSVTASSAVTANRSTAGADLGHGFGALTLGNGSTLSLNPGSNLTANAAYGVTFGATTLNSNAGFAVANNGAGTGTLTLGALNDAGTARTVTKTGAGALTLGGAATSLVDGTAFNVSAGTLNANNATALGTLANVTLAGTAALNVNNASQTVGALNGVAGTSVAVAGTNTLTIGNATNNLNSVFAGNIAGAGGGAIAKSGGGALTLSGTNTYTGNTTLNTGTLNLGSASAIGTGTFVIAGGTFDNTSGSALTLSTNNAQTWSGNLAFTGSNNLNLGTGAVTLTGSRQVSVAGNTLIVGGAIGDGGSGYALTKTGNGALTLGGANTFSGGTTLSAGTLNVNSTSALGSGTFTNAGGTVDNTSGGAIVLSTNNAQTWTGDLAFTGSNNLNLGTGAVTLTGSRQVSVAGNTLVVGGAIGDGGSGYAITKTGNGALTLGGASTFSGGTTLSAGTLNVNSASALGTGAFTIGGGTLDNTSGGALTLSTNNAQAWNADFAFTGTNNLNLGTGAVTLGASRIVTANAGTLTVGGAIGGGAVSLTKAGSGTLVFGGANTYSGGTTLGAGTLTVNSGATLAASTGALTVNGGTLNLNNAAQTVGSLNGSAGTIALGAGHNFTVNTSGTDAFSGAFTGGATSTLTKNGTGSLALSGASTGFSGAVAVNNGTLALSSASALGTSNAGTTIASGGTISLLGSVSLGTSALNVTGTGSNGTGALLNVSGTNTWNGNVTLGGNTTLTSAAGILRLGVTPTTFTPNAAAQPTESGYVTLGTNTLTFTGSGSVIVNDRIRDFAGQTAATRYANANTVSYQPETTSPGNVVVDMSGGASVRYRANANSYTGTTTIKNGTLIVDTVTNSGAPHDPNTDQFHGINGAVVIGDGDSTGATLQLGNGGAANEVLASTTAISILKDGTFNLNNQGQTIGALTFTGGTVALGTGTLYLNSDVTVNASAGNTASITGSTGFLSMTLHRDVAVDTGPDATRTFTVNHGLGNTYDLTIGGILQSGNLVKAGDGTMMLNNNNTYTGTTSVTNGILNIQAGTDGSSRSGLGSGNGTDAQGTTVSSGATLQFQGGIAVTTEKLNIAGAGYNPGTGVLGAINNLSGNNTIGAGAASTLINLDSDARINASGGNLTLATNIGSSSNNALSVGVASGSTVTISGSIATGSGSTTTLTKDDAGTLVLTGSNSYQGATNVNAGVLSVQNNFALGAATSGANGTFVTSGAELQLSNVANGNLTIAGEALTLNGAGVGGAQGALRNVAGNNSYGGLVTLGSASTIKSDAGTLTLSGGTSSANYALTIAGAGNTTISGTMSNGSGALTKNDSGTLTVSGSTATVGKTHLNAGTISVGGSTTMNTAEFDSAVSTTLLIASGGTVVANYASGSTTFAGAISSTGTYGVDASATFQKNGAGTLVFDHTFNAGANSVLVLNGGTLSLTGSQITFGTIHITGNTILDFNNSAGTFLSSAQLVIDAGVTVTVNNWVSVANNSSLSTVWYATNTVNAGTLGGVDVKGGTPLAQITFTNYNGLTTTWVSGTHDGWFNHEIRPTPEPATYGAIFVSGCVGLLGWRRYRRAKPGSSPSETA